MIHEPIDEKEVFNNARRLAVPEERVAYLQQVCGHEPKAFHRILELLNVYFQESSFLGRPAVVPDPNGTAGWEMTESASAVGTVIGPYKLLEEIGEGGMGLVFVAEQQQPVRRKVALKIIKPGMDSRQVIARFEAERQALAMMDHPNIAQVHDGGSTPEGRPYFVMELVKGTPITDYCDSHRLTTRQRLQLFLDVCAAVQHAHQKGIIHRDLKPSNVLVSHHDVTPVVKVIDFGIAKATSGRLTDKTLYTAFAQMVGTPLYMSPEQAGLSDLDVDTRSDVYSLGVLLYELLTGTTPFDSETLKKAGYDEIRRVIREDEPPRPSTRLSTMRQAALSTIAEKRGLEPRRLSQQLRGELDWIVMKALEKDRNRRYESASALAADVRRHLSDEPVEASPPSTAYRLRKLARRNRKRLAASALALLLGLVAVGILGALQLQKAGRMRQLEQDVQQALAGARTAIEARDLALARQRVAEAQGRLGTEGASLPGLVADIYRTRDEIQDRQADEGRFQQFVTLASDAQDKMSHVILWSAGGADQVAGEALDLYSVLGEDGWFARVEQSHLTDAQKQQVREMAYVLLVSLADYEVQWDEVFHPRSAPRSLDLLRRAQAFHPPTRAFYFVRSECHRLQSNTAAAEADQKQFQTSAAQTAWDYFLPGRRAGNKGDLKGAIRAYQAALAVQPNHYNSLFFLAEGLADDKVKRYAEALQLFTGCVALRPDVLAAYWHRAECHQKLGQLEEAEADYSAAIGAATDERNRILAYIARCQYYLDQRLTEKARQDQARIFALAQQWQEKARATLDPLDILTMSHLADFCWGADRKKEAIQLLEQVLNQQKAQLDRDHQVTRNFIGNLAHAYKATGRLQEAVALGEQLVKMQKATLGADHPKTVFAIRYLADAYCELGRVPEAIALLEPTLEKSKASLGPDHPDTLYTMNSLALAYQRVGRLPEAIALFDQTVKKAKAKLGPDHHETLDIMHNLAGAYQAGGRLPEAIALHQQILEKSKATLGLDHRNTLVGMHALATAYQEADRLQEAIALHQQTVERMKAKFGPDHPDTLHCLHNLALAYQGVGRLPEAIALHQQVLEKRKATLGPDHLDTLNSMHNLAGAYHAAQKFDLALPLWEKTLKLRKAMLGPDHPNTIGSMNGLACVYEAAGKLDLALPLHEETLKLRRTTLGPDHPHTLGSMHNLAQGYHLAEKLDLALPLYEETLKLRKAKLGPDHRDTLSTMHMLAYVYQDTGKFDKADPLWRDLLERHRKKDGAKPAETAAVLASLGLNLLKQQKYTEAEPLLRECLAIREQKLPDKWQRFNAQSLLGGALLGQQKYPEAEPLLLQGYEGMKQREAQIPLLGKKRLAEAIERVVQLYEATQQPEKARAWREKRPLEKAPGKKE